MGKMLAKSSVSMGMTFVSVGLLRSTSLRISFSQRRLFHSRPYPSIVAGQGLLHTSMDNNAHAWIPVNGNHVGTIARALSTGS